VLPALLGLAEPLAARYQTRVELSIAEGLPQAAIGEMALRQVLLCLLTTTISLPSETAVRLGASYDEREQALRIALGRQTIRRSEGAPFAEGPSIDLANRLATLCGSRLSISLAPESFSAVLAVPVLGATPILAIDDNPDTLQLLERYVAGSRYRLIATPDPAQALSLVRRFRPRVIVLDVMMPRIDGWEVLGRLREDAASANVPIIVSTILPQSDLATALGASAFLRKPVTREAFLATLDRLIRGTATQASD
jgi:CheY-like chemotaxis protein